MPVKIETVTTKHGTVETKTVSTPKGSIVTKTLVPGDKFNQPKPSANLKHMQPLATTTMKKPGKPEVQAQEPVGKPVPVEDGNYAMVGMSAKRKFSDGNYGSTEVGVWLSMPCKPTYHEIEQTYEGVYSWVDQKMNDLLTDTPVAPKKAD